MAKISGVEGATWLLSKMKEVRQKKSFQVIWRKYKGPNSLLNLQKVLIFRNDFQQRSDPEWGDGFLFRTSEGWQCTTGQLRHTMTLYLS